MNSVGPLLNDMPDNQASLDQTNHSGPLDPLNDGEGDMQMFVSNFVKACENEKKHE